MQVNKILISILNYNGSEDTLACLQSFYRYEEKSKYCIVIWDNASSENEKQVLLNGISKLDLNWHFCSVQEYASMDDITEYDLLIVFSPQNLGFAKGNNEVINRQLDKFPMIVLLNNDTEFIGSTTSRLVSYLYEHNDIGGVTSAIYYWKQKDKVWNAGGKFCWGSRKYFTESYVAKKIKNNITEQSVEFVTGCYLVLKSEVLKKYGVFTEKFFFGEEDYEFCMRMAQNKVKLMVLLNEKIYHKVGASISRNSDMNDMIRKTFIHHLNRFIDMKDYYKKRKWDIWRFFSSIYIGLLILKSSNFRFKLMFRYIKKLNWYAKCRNDVDSEFFLTVIKGEIF